MPTPTTNGSTTSSNPLLPPRRLKFTHDIWMDSLGLPLYTGYYIQDLREPPLLVVLTAPLALTLVPVFVCGLPFRCSLALQLSVLLRGVGLALLLQPLLPCP